MRVMGIDPGVSATGAVLVNSLPPVILSVKTIRTSPGEDKSFDSLVSRTRLVVSQLRALCDEWTPDVLVIEGYEDIAPMRLAKLRFYTPFLLGFLTNEFEYKLVFQSPKIKSAWRDQKSWWENSDVRLYPGDDKLTNDHLRDAAIHALHFIQGGDL